MALPTILEQAKDLLTFLGDTADALIGRQLIVTEWQLASQTGFVGETQIEAEQSYTPEQRIALAAIVAYKVIEIAIAQATSGSTNSSSGIVIALQTYLKKAKMDVMEVEYDKVSSSGHSGFMVEATGLLTRYLQAACLQAKSVGWILPFCTAEALLGLPLGSMVEPIDVPTTPIFIPMNQAFGGCGCG